MNVEKSNSKIDRKQVAFTYFFLHPTIKATNKISYNVKNNGTLIIKSELLPEDGALLTYMPGYGVIFAISGDYKNVSY